jgi:L-ribulokinase
MTVVAGIDFGTLSVRVSLVDSSLGILGTGSAAYPLHKDPTDPCLATQKHGDHLQGLSAAMGAAISNAKISGDAVAALAIATTGSSVLPVDRHLQPLGDYYLWCDHRAQSEAEEITRKGSEMQLEALRWCGGTYSPEWGFAKLLHWLRTHPDGRARFATALEHGDMMVATLCGHADPDGVARGICAMGHKWMWNESLGGLPPQEFLTAVDPLLNGMRDKLGGTYGAADGIAGHLSAAWAKRLGLRAGLPVPYPALDAHSDAIGAGIRLGDIVNVVGTSTCIMALSRHAALIPGVSGVVDHSIHPKHVGIEAGLSACGAVFEAIALRSGRGLTDLARECTRHRPGQTGLLRLPWDNGDRTILGNPALRGLTLGWNLSHTAADELFAAFEGTAFHTKVILDHLGAFAVPAARIINAGGLPQHIPALNQLYANVLNKPVCVPKQATTGLGSAIFASLAAGAFSSIEAAQDALCPGYREYHPQRQAVSVYGDLYDAFRKIYFLFGDGGPAAQAAAGVLNTLCAASQGDNYGG